MKKCSKLLALLLALALILGMPAEALAAEKDAPLAGTVVILHSNDVHGAVEGYATMAALKAYYRELGAKVLLVDAGDYIQGTTYVSVSKGETAVELMNLAGYDYAALGNHEFDYGYENIAALAEKANFDILSANTFYNGQPAFGAHVVADLGGVKVGVFGLGTPETATKAHPAKIQGVTFLGGGELYACAQAEVDALRAAGCDYVVCLGHLGVDDETAATANRSIDMLEKVTGIDVLIDGHSHSTIADITGKTGGDDNRVGGTYVTSTGAKFANYGVVTISPEGQITTELLSAGEAAALVTPDATVAARTAEIVREIEDIYGAAFATTEVRLNGDRNPGNRTEETNLGDLITDAIRWYATKDGGLAVDDDHVVALTNGGGIRAAVETGSITMNDVNSVLPFGNTVAIVYVTGEALLEALEASTFETPTAIGGFPQVAGIRFSVDTTVPFDQGEAYPGTTYFQPASVGRVTIDSVNGKPFDPTATYAVVTNDFTAAGGDTYYAFSVANVIDTGTPMDEALIAYITEVLDGTVTAAAYGDAAGRIYVQRYADVPAGADYARYIEKATAAGAVNGVGSQSYAPAAAATYAQLTTALARLAGVDTAGKVWYAAGMDWAAEKGLTVGEAADTVDQTVAVALLRALYHDVDAAALAAALDEDTVLNRGEMALLLAAVAA